MIGTRQVLQSVRWAALALLLPVAAHAQTSQQHDDKLLLQILQELREIRQLLTKDLQANAALRQQLGGKPVKTAVVSVEGAFALGSQDAPLTMVEFTDFQCPYCQRFHAVVFGELKKNYIDTGKLRYVSRDLPLDSHPNAVRLAGAARCSGEQNQFWAMRDRMQSTRDELNTDRLMGFAQDLKLNVAQFRSCLESGKFLESIKNDVVIAKGIGAAGTPSFVIGRNTPDGVEGEVIVGALPYQVLDQKLRAILE